MSNRLVDDVVAERKRATDELARYGVRAVDPAASESQLWESGKKARIGAKFSYKVMQAMREHDLFLIRRSDALVFLTADIASEGSILEMSYAQKIGIPVILVAPERVKGNFMGWVNVSVPPDHICSTIEEAAKFINRRYKKVYEKNHKYFEAAIKNATKAVNATGKKGNKKSLDK
jgi:hypothetical protein